MPLHPQLVHLPIALAMLLPLFSAGVLVAWHKALLPRAAFVIVVVMQALLVGGAMAASRSGEIEEPIVEPVVGHDAIEAHEQAGNMLVLSSIVLLLVGIAVARTKDEAKARKIGAAMTLGMCLSAFFAFRAGEAGGRLVYELGAAEAHRAERTAVTPP